MKVYYNKVVFIVFELIKIFKFGKQCIILEFLLYDKDLCFCLVSCFKEYLDRIVNMRQDYYKLLVSYQKLYKFIFKDIVV